MLQNFIHNFTPLCFMKIPKLFHGGEKEKLIVNVNMLREVCKI